jgi:DNA-binding transcriptional LysR family regulator
LETELGVELVDRGRAESVLTEAGRILLRRARRAMDELDAARSELDELAGLERGHVRAGAIHWLEPFDLPGALAQFSEAHPKIELSLRESDAAQMVEELRDGALDLVIANAPLEGYDEPGRIAADRLVSEDLVVLISPDHELAARRRLRLSEIEDERIVAFRAGSALRDLVDAAFELAGASHRPTLETSDLLAVRALVSRSLGFAVVPRSLAVAEGPPVAVAELVPRPPRREVMLLWRADHRPAPAAAALIAYLRSLAID